MDSGLQLYNTLSRQKEDFKVLHPPYVGMYVCGPTVYGDAHLGHARPAITFDILFRYLKHLGYKVRYVRNITDVGHLENDADHGEDKVAKKARLEQLEPMEVVQYYMNQYHELMRAFNVMEPSIEPQASGHIIEQIEMIKQIKAKGYAYEVDGSVYFDVEKYNKSYDYGILSGRKMEDLLSSTRHLEGQDRKKNPADFALWKKAQPEHIMRWPSPWSEGFPGWHMECSAMGRKYLGDHFDIHGGGMDLIFPHHESEIAQSNIANGKQPVRYWIHNNMITINGQKMGKSLGNAVSLLQFFSGAHELLEQAYSPMTIRFFILQAHYRSTLDFSNEALKAAEKGYQRMGEARAKLEDLKAAEESNFDWKTIRNQVVDALNDDLNTPIALAHLFEMVKVINKIHEDQISLNKADLADFSAFFTETTEDILGLKFETGSDDHGLSEQLMQFILDMRAQAKAEKNWTLADKIRDGLSELNIQIKDSKEGSSWERR